MQYLAEVGISDARAFLILHSKSNKGWTKVVGLINKVPEVKGVSSVLEMSWDYLLSPSTEVAWRLL